METKRKVSNIKIANARRKYERQIESLQLKLADLQKKCKHPNTHEWFDDQRYHVCDDCNKIW